MTREDLDAWSHGNWTRIPEGLRRKCLDHLHEEVDPGTATKWRSLDRIGDGDPFFHFGVGMAVRNVLREVMPDDDLPPVDYDGVEYQNWDDFYVGALADFLEELKGYDEKGNPDVGN